MRLRHERRSSQLAVQATRRCDLVIQTAHFPVVAPIGTRSAKAATMIHEFVRGMPRRLQVLVRWAVVSQSDMLTLEIAAWSRIGC